jgi:hypothetical protein
MSSLSTTSLHCPHGPFCSVFELLSHNLSDRTLLEDLGNDPLSRPMYNNTSLARQVDQRPDQSAFLLFPFRTTQKVSRKSRYGVLIRLGAEERLLMRLSASAVHILFVYGTDSGASAFLAQACVVSPGEYPGSTILYSSCHKL